jgi:hypothetical protein
MKRKDDIRTPANDDHRESNLWRKLRKIAEEYEARGGKLLSREEGRA